MEEARGRQHFSDISRNMGVEAIADHKCRIHLSALGDTTILPTHGDDLPYTTVVPHGTRTLARGLDGTNLKVPTQYMRLFPLLTVHDIP